jgi:hypothetical protein
MKRVVLYFKIKNPRKWMAMDPPKKFLSCILQAAEQWERED